MIKDENKNITAIAYNHLGLPLLIEFGTAETDKIEYLYDATGTKLGKKVSFLNTDTSTTETKTTDYLDGFQYVEGQLQFFPTSEGYVKDTFFDDEHHFNYVYQYKDHLGNVRLTYGWDPHDDKLVIMVEDNYYPYGLKHRNYNMTENEYERIFPSGVGIEEVDNGVYNYKYNGKEWQDELGLNMYDMDLRDYDPAIGRWVCIDPVTHYSQSTYNGFDGNPVYWADPSGGDSVDGVTASGTEAVSIYNALVSAMDSFGGGFSIIGASTNSGAEEYSSSALGLEGDGGGGGVGSIVAGPGPSFGWALRFLKMKQDHEKESKKKNDRPSAFDIGNGLSGTYLTALDIYAQENANKVYTYGTSSVSAAALTQANTSRMLNISNAAQNIGNALGIITGFNSWLDAETERMATGKINIKGYLDGYIGMAGGLAGAVLTFGLTSNPVGWGIIATGAAVWGISSFVIDLYKLGKN